MQNHCGIIAVRFKPGLTPRMVTDTQMHFPCPAHLFMGDRNESVFGQFSHDVEVRPHVQLAANQHHFGTGTELLCLTLPL